MSSNSDTLRFTFLIEKKGDIAWINQFSSAVQKAMGQAISENNRYASSVNSSTNQVSSAYGKLRRVYDEHGKYVRTVRTAQDELTRSMASMGGPLNNVAASLAKTGKEYQSISTFAKQAVGSMGTFDTSLRRQTASLNQGHAAATSYSAIFKTIPASINASTAAINQNANAATAATAKQQQYGAVMRNVAAMSTNLSNALNRQNTAITQTAANMDKLTMSQERANQQTMSTVRGFTTLFMGLMMINQSTTDFRLNQESMADLNAKLEETQNRLNEAVEKYGENSYLANQARQSLQKTERAIRYENREMANQIQNQIFLLSMIGSNIAMELIPAFQNWGQTMERLRGFKERFIGTLGRARTSINSFGTALVTGAVPAVNVMSERMRQLPTDVDDVTRKIGGLNPVIMTSSGVMKNHGDIVSGLGDGYSLYGKSIEEMEKKQAKATSMGDKFRGGLARIGAVIGSGGGVGLLGAIAGMSVGLALYNTNAGGARDMTNNFGVQVGKMHPLLKMMGEGLLGIAGAMGISGASAIETNRAFERAGEGFHEFTTGWHNALETMKNDTNAAVSAIGNALATLSGGLSTAGEALSGAALIDPNGDRDVEGRKLWQKQKDFQHMISPWAGAAFDSQYGNQESGPNENFMTNVYDKYVQSLKQKEQIKEAEEAIDESKLKTFALTDFRDPKNEATLSSADDIAKYLDYLREESALYKQLENEVGEYTAVYQDFVNTRKNATVQGEILRHGQALYNATLAQETVELQKSNAYLDAYAIGLKTTDGIQRELNKGKTETKEAFIQEQAAVIQNVGAYQELSNQLLKQNGLQVAYNTGQTEAVLASLNRAKAIAEETGALDVQHNLLAAGVTQIYAYTEGVNAQRTALYESMEAASNANGQLAELTSQMKDNTAQAAAYNQAYAETQLAIQRTGVEIAAAKGEFNAWALAAKQGVIAGQAFAKGVIDQNNALKSNYETLYASIGAYTQFNQQLATGVPQGIAYAQTIMDLEMATANVDIELAKAVATLDYFNKGVESVEPVATTAGKAMIDLNKGLEETIKQSETAGNVLLEFSSETALAFVNGANSVEQWWKELKLAEHAQVGATFAAAGLAQRMGVTLPEGFKGGSEAIQQFVALAKRIPSAIAPVRDELKGIFDNMISGFADAMKEGEDELDDAIEEFSDSLGIKFNKGVTEALEFHAGTELFTDLSKEFGALIIGIGQNLDEDSFDGLRDNIVEKLETTMDKALDDIQDGPLKENITESYQNIIDLFNGAELKDVQSPTAITNLIGDLGMGFIELQGHTNNFGIVWDELMTAMAAGDWVEVNRLLKEANINMENIDKITFDKITGQFVAVQTQVQLTAEAAKELEDTLESIADKYEGMDFSNVKSQFDEINKAYEDKGIEEHITVTNKDPDGKIGKTQTSQSEVTVPLFGQGGAADQATIDETITSLDELKTKVTETMTEVQATVATGMASAYQSALAYFKLIGEASSQVPVLVTTNYNTANSNANGVLAMMQEQATLRFEAIGQSSIAIATGVTENYNTANSNANGVLATMQQQAALRFEAIGNSAIAIATGVTENYNTANDNANGILGEMQTQAELRFKAMGDAAVAVAEGVDTHFGKAADDGMALMDALERSVVANMEAMATAAGDVAAAIDDIGEAADTAKGKVDTLAQAIESIPSEKTVTVKVNYVAGPKPDGLARGGTIYNLAAGGLVTGKGNQTVITGESGDEFVRIIDQYGQAKERLVKDITAFQLKKGESIDVVPLQGYYGKRFEQLYGNILNMAQGNNAALTETPMTVGATTASGATLDNSNVINVRPLYIGNKLITNAIPVHIVGSDVGSLTGATGGNSGSSSGSGGGSTGTIGQTVNNGGIGNGPLNIGGGNDPSMNGSNVGQNNGDNYQRRPDTGPDGLYSDNEQRKFAGTADVGVSPAVKNKLARKPGINFRNEVELTNGDRYTIEEWNALPDSKRIKLAEKYGFFAIPEGSYINEDYSITPHHYQRPLNSRSGPNPHDPNATRPSGSGGGSGSGTGGTVAGDHARLGNENVEYKTTNTGYSVPDYIATSGGSKWNNPNMNPATWKSTKMTGSKWKGLWKVVDDKDVIIAAEFKTQEQADEFISEHRAAYIGDDRTSTTGGGAVSTPSGSNGNSRTQTINQTSVGGNNYNYQNNNMGNGPITIDPYNRNLTAGQWGKSYLGDGIWYDPLTGTYTDANGNVVGGPNGGIGNGNSMGQGPIQIVTAGNARVEQGPNGQRIIINGQELVNNPAQGTNVSSTANNALTVTDPLNSNSFTGGNVSNNSNNNSSVQTGGQNNFNYAVNGRRLVVQNGQIIENTLTPEEYAQADAMYFRLTGRHLPTGSGGGGSGSGGSSGRIYNKNLGKINLTGTANNTDQALYNNIDAFNDPTGIHDYPIIPDPLFKTISTRSLLGGNTGDGGGGDPTNPEIPDLLFDISKILKQILSAIFSGRTTNVKIGDRDILEIIEGNITDGFSNYK